MKNKSNYSLLLLIILLSFPSICSSEMKTVQGKYCDVYTGDIRDKEKLEEVRNQK